VFDHAPPHTYSPDIADLLRNAVTWASSPGGNLLWDLFVAALSILITVTVIQRYIDRLEERRWAPARDRAYYRLFLLTENLMRHVPYHRRTALRKATYRFGSQGTISAPDYGKEFRQTVWEIDVREFEPAVEHWSSSPGQTEAFQRSVERLSDPEIAVFMAREPELGRAIGVLRERALQAASALRRYWHATSRGSPSRASREYFNVEGAQKEAIDRVLDRMKVRRMGAAKEEAMEQACIALRQLVLATYDLHLWFIDQADSVESRSS
jgi:hypothetical protein